MSSVRCVVPMLILLVCSVTGQWADARVVEESQATTYDQVLEAFVAPSKTNQAVDEDVFNQAADYPDEPSSAITRALRQVEAHESSLPASRYLVRGWLKYVANQPQLQLEISRYNHGKRITAELQRDYGADARDALVSDDAPHIRYRMGIMQVPMTQQFDVLMPHRRVLHDVLDASCLRAPCLQPAFDDDGEPLPPLVKAKRVPHTPQPNHVRVMDDGLPHVSWLAEALMKEAGLHRGLDEMEPREGGGNTPDFVLRLDDRVYGQDDTHHGVLCQYDVMDDAIKDICWQVMAMPGTAPMWHKYIVSRTPAHGQIQP